MSGGYYNRLYRAYSDSVTPNQLRNAVFKNRLDLLYNKESSHPDEHSNTLSEVELLDRVITTDENRHKEVASKFLHDDWMASYVGTTIVENADDIVEWVNCRNNEHPKYNKHTNRNEVLKRSKGFSSEMEEFVGSGFMIDKTTNQIHEYLTNKICVVVNNEPYRDFGLSVFTSYPDIMRDSKAVPTHRDLTDILKKTDTYRKASPVDKAILEFRCSEHSMSKVKAIKTKEADATNPQKIIIKLAMNNPNFEAVINITENKFIMGVAECDTKIVHNTYDLTKEPYMLTKDFPEESKWIIRMKDTIDNCTAKLSKSVQRYALIDAPEPEVETTEDQYTI